MTRVEFITAKLIEGSTETAYGFHWIQDFLTNPWKFYLRNVLGLKPRNKKGALNVGSTVHAAIECHYQTGASIDDSWRIMKDIEVVRRTPGVEPMTDEDWQRGAAMFYAWANKLLPTYESTYRFVAAEVPIQIRLRNGFEMTGKLDRLFELLQDSNQLVPAETKTTGFSLTKMFEQVSNGDQVRVYYMGAGHTFAPKRVAYILPEILYARGRVADASNVTPINPTERSLFRCEMNLIGAFGRLYQALLLLQCGYPPEMLFPRNASNYAEQMFGDDYAAVVELDHQDYNRPAYLHSIGWHRIPTADRLNNFMTAWSQTKDARLFFNNPKVPADSRTLPPFEDTNRTVMEEVANSGAIPTIETGRTQRAELFRTLSALATEAMRETGFPVVQTFEGRQVT